MNIKKYTYVFAVLVVFATLAGAVSVSADNEQIKQPNNGIGSMMRNRGGEGIGKGGAREMMKPGVFGTVSAISGNTITVISKKSLETNAVTTTFTIDATNAKITKNNVVGTIASILVGDTVAIQGTITGTNVVATNIRDGAMMPGRGGNSENSNKPGKEISDIVGNGQPVVLGTVSAVNGSTLTITNKSNVTYTVDVASAKITQGKNTILVSGVVVGDNIVVQGVVNGNSIVASNIIDQAKPAGTTANNEAKQGFFGKVGSFFSHLFGY